MCLQLGLDLVTEEVPREGDPIVIERRGGVTAGGVNPPTACEAGIGRGANSHGGRSAYPIGQTDVLVLQNERLRVSKERVRRRLRAPWGHRGHKERASRRQHRPSSF